MKTDEAKALEPGAVVEFRHQDGEKSLGIVTDNTANWIAVEWHKGGPARYGYESRLLACIERHIESPAVSTTLLFVYGTLKSGHGNNAILKGARKLGDAWTEGGFTLFGGGFPKMIRTRNKNLTVKGEVWAVGPETLRATDHLEAIEMNPPMYTRESIVVLLDDGQFGKAESYIWASPTDPFPWIGSDWGKLDDRHRIAPGLRIEDLESILEETDDGPEDSGELHWDRAYRLDLDGLVFKLWRLREPDGAALADVPDDHRLPDHDGLPWMLTWPDGLSGYCRTRRDALQDVIRAIEGSGLRPSLGL
jgi:gamma-glutamylaminecyclotransferase